MAFDFGEVNGPNEHITINSILINQLESIYTDYQEYFNKLTMLQIESVISNQHILHILHKSKGFKINNNLITLFSGEKLSLPIINYMAIPTTTPDFTSGISLDELEKYLKNNSDFNIINKNSIKQLDIELYSIWNTYKNHLLDIIKNKLNDSELYDQIYKGYNVAKHWETEFFDNIYVQSDYNLIYCFMPQYKQAGQFMKLCISPYIIYIGLSHPSIIC